MDITKSPYEFQAWWNAPEQAELRNSCTMGWGFRIWKAARESIVVERISPTDVPPDVVYQLGGAGLSHSMAICEAYSTGFNAALLTAGIRIKGESE